MQKGCDTSHPFLHLSTSGEVFSGPAMKAGTLASVFSLQSSIFVN